MTSPTLTAVSTHSSGATSSTLLARNTAQKIAGIEIKGTPARVDWVGGVNPGGQSLQGALMFARSLTGTGFFYLQGTNTNYLLKNDNGALITNQVEAEQRARQMIANGGASQLRPLDSAHTHAPTKARPQPQATPRPHPQPTRPAASAQHSAPANANKTLIAGIEITGKPMRLDWIGGVNPTTKEPVQGALMSGRKPDGGLIFWLQGTDTNYLLKNANGTPVSNPLDARERARELIAKGGATHLRRLESKYAGPPPVGTQSELVRYIETARTALSKQLQNKPLTQQNLGDMLQPIGQRLFGWQSDYSRASEQLQTIQQQAVWRQITPAQARSQVDRLLKQYGIDFNPKTVPVAPSVAPKDGATRRTELADPRYRTVGQTLNGQTIQTHLVAEQHYDARYQTWVTDRLVAKGIEKYSRTPLNGAQERKKPDHPQFGYFVSSVGKEVVITDKAGKPITDPAQARTRVLEMFQHGGLTSTTAPSC